MKRFKLFGVILALVFFSLSPAFAQQPTQKMKTELVKLKYLEANQIQVLLRPYFSKEGVASFAPDKRDLITITDYPEIVQKILAVIKEIDVKPVDLLFTVQLVQGSESAEDKTEDLLGDDPIIRELKGLLKYKSFTLLDSNLIRTIDRSRSEITMGKNGGFVLEVWPKYAKEANAEIIQLGVKLNHVWNITPPAGAQITRESVTRESQTFIETNLTLKSGDKTVVGVSKMDGGDKGLILIISGKVIK